MHSHANEDHTSHSPASLFSVITSNIFNNTRAMTRFIISYWMILMALSLFSLTSLFLLPLYKEETIIRRLIMERNCPEEKYKYKNSRIRQYSPFCGPYSLKSNKFVSERRILVTENQNASHTCRISSVDKLICEDIKDMFYRSAYSDDHHCPVKSSFEFCKLKNQENINWQNIDNLMLSCDFCPCDKNSPFSIGFTDNETGLHKWLHVSISQHTEHAVQREAIKTLKAGNPYLFFRCTSKKTLDYITNLLVLPYVPLGENRLQYVQNENHQEKSQININIIWIDAVSRPHFYRSLPRTIEYLKKLQISDKHHVLDFERFHSIKARTFESLHAFFTGELIHVSSEFEGIAVPPQSVGFHKLLKMFKEHNYNTLYQEDLCWEHDWGLIRDTGVFKEKIVLSKRFSVLNSAFRKNFIENLGVTHSSCEIFHSYNIVDHFNYPPEVCYGARLQHDFFLEYLLNAIKSMKEKPLFSFTLLNVGHEGTGKRISTLDSSLKNFLSQLEGQEDTINILFSDHGMHYGPFSTTSQGRFEMFHPFLFMIIPHLVADKIGNSKMRNLEINQKRLFTLVDMHYTMIHLLSIISRSNKKSDNSIRVRTSKQKHANNGASNDHKKTINFGLFREISSKRGCDELKLLLGTLCYCEGWKTKLSVTSSHYLISEFALAMLNKMIIQSQVKTRSKTAGSTHNFCQHLQGYSVKNVWQRRKRLIVLYGMDIVTQQSSIFSVVVSTKIDRPKSLELQLDSIERLSRYGQYRRCANPNIDLKLCICAVKGSKGDTTHFPGSAIGSMFGIKTTSRLIHFPCFFILSRTYKAGVVFEGSNVCSNVSYTVDLSFQLTNMKLAQESGKTKVPPGSVRYLATSIMTRGGFEWNWKYSIDLEWTRVKKKIKNKGRPRQSIDLKT